jgi:hypothetical protein
LEQGASLEDFIILMYEKLSPSLEKAEKERIPIEGDGKR